MQRYYVEPVCAECHEPLQIGQLIRKFGNPQRFIHNDCYVPRTLKEPKLPRKNWDVPTPELSLEEKRSWRLYFCSKCQQPVHSITTRKGKFIINMSCELCGEVISGPAYRVVKSHTGFCAFCGKIKTNKCLAMYDGCCSNGCRRKMREKENKEVQTHSLLA